jgi:hypothetical protein
MKQGSADDPFADTEQDTAGDEESATDQEATETEQDTPANGDDVGGMSASTEKKQKGDSSTGVQRQSLPYIHSRDGVKDGRTQRPVFLREHIETGIDDLVDHMETEFGEDVYKTDVTEAAMIVAQENPELVVAKLEEWGYGWS